MVDQVAEVFRRRRIRVIVLSNKLSQRAGSASADADEPDPERLHRLLAERGIDLIRVAMFPVPVNPWARSAPFFAGIDPVRSMMVLLRHRSADMIVSVFESGAILPALLRRLLRFRPQLVVWDCSVGSAWRPKRWAMRLVLPRADQVFALTGWQARAVEARYRLRTPPVVIGYAVDETFYHPEFNRLPEFILAVGEDEGRDYGTMIAAVKVLPARVVMKTLRALDVPRDTTADITVERRFLSHFQLRDLYARASLVVLPLHRTDNPSGITSLFEAMAMGKAIIASDVPMMREFLDDGQNGLLVPVGDAAAMRDAIAGLLVSPHTRQRLGANARSALMARHAMPAFADRYAASVRACLAAESIEPARRVRHVRGDIANPNG